MFEKELEAAINAGLAAKEGILDIYHTDFNVEIKSDNSPVTLADKNADALIRKLLHDAFPTYAFLTEEAEDDKTRLTNDYVWIVDPVDGTKDFVAKNGQFTTNIALSYKHEAVVGVVVVPASNEVYYACKGLGAYHMKDGMITPIKVNDKVDDLTVLCSNFHLSKADLDVIERHKDIIKHIERKGSSIKACYIASGKAEISYRMNLGTKEWDTAAFQVIVEEAGGHVLTLSKERIMYNREDVYNKEYVVINNLKNFLI